MSAPRSPREKAPGPADPPGREGGGPAPWTEVDDREELRRSLQRLMGADRLGPQDEELVRFFFRASDPVLYPLAAVTLGRQVVRSSTTAAWLADYARRRRIALHGRIALTGRRSDRRVLLAAAAAVARDRSSWIELTDPEGVEDPDDPILPLPPEAPRDPADLGTYLRACRVLLEGGGATAALVAHVDAVLGGVAGRPELLRDPPAAARWGELLAARGRRPADHGEVGEAATRGRTVLAALRAEAEAPGPRGIGPRISLLRAAQGLVVGSGGLVEAQDDAAVHGAELRRLVVDALEQAAEPRTWWAGDEPERARRAFLLLDAASGGRLPPGEMRALLDAFGAPPSTRAAARVLLLLAEREGADPAELVDVTLLHSLEDEAVLLRLVPSGPPGDSGAAVADALEHRIRMGLATEPSFRPEELLLRIEARRPHPAFFQLLKAVTADRDYVHPDGAEIPMAAWLEALHDDARRLKGGEAAGASPPVRGAIGEARARIRRELRELEAVDDPPRLLRDLAVLLHGGGEERDGRPERDLHLLLGALEGDEAPGLESALHHRAATLRREAERIVPGKLDGSGEARIAADTAREAVADVLAELAPRLPAAEGSLLEEVGRALDAALGAWMEALSRVEATWRAASEARREEPGWRGVLVAAAEVPSPAHRERLLPLVWRTLAASVRSGAGAAQDGSHERLIRWAVRSGALLPEEEDRSCWLAAVADHWGAMVEAGIEEGLETRVARLVREPGRELVRLPDVDAALERTRVWFFDCYRIQDAAHVTGILNERRGRGVVTTLPRDLLAFFLHYSPVWLALLVGAILMLDFGDAWTAMAEVGDVRGVAITFALGVIGAFGYATAELHARVRDAPGDRVWANRGRRFLRTLTFVGVCLGYTVAVVGLLWWLLSGTGEVVHGPGAVLHVVVWSGFALFVGIFFGLLAKSG